MNRLLCRAAVFFLLALLGFSVPFAARGDTERSPRQMPGWQLTFDDEFSGTRLDARKWTSSTGTFPNRSEPVQYFLPKSVTLRGGALHIKSEYRLSHGHQFTSGEIRTLDKFSQRYGRLETRCRFPKAPGTWSAVYLLPADDSWPPEIDAAEYIGRDPQKIYLTNHWKDADGEHQQINCDWKNPTADWGKWHTYALEWQPNGVRWYIDGVLRGAAPPPLSDVPMYVRINSAVGGNFAGPPQTSAWPQTFEVDYVRVYHRRGGPKPIWGAVPHFVPPPPLPQTAAASSPVPIPSEAAEEGRLDWGDAFLLLAVPLFVWGWMRRRTDAHGARTAALGAGVAVSAAGYVLFRVQVIHWAAWWIALPLIFAEAHGLLHTLGLQYTLWPRPPLELGTGELGTGELGTGKIGTGKIGTGELGGPAGRPIFLFIPTVNEGTAVLEPTLRGAQAACARYRESFPEADVTIVVCNDGFVAGYPDWQEAEALAERLEVACVTRPVGGGAKAGNIEFARQAVGAVGDALLVLFDADQIAEEEFLLRTLPPFADPTIAWVQTGQYYRNLENPVARWANDQQALFYQVLCPGKAALNSAFICGTNVAIRASALDEIGGLPRDSVTEDFAASLLLHPRWRSVFLPQVLATGLGPMDLSAYFAQQGRWATGTLGVLRRHWRMIFLPSVEVNAHGLSVAQRVQYGLACTHYLSGLRDLIYFFVPFLFLLLGASAIEGTDLVGFLVHFLPYFVFGQLAFWHAARRKTTWRGIALGFGSFPVLLASLLLVLLGQRVGFAVTPKKRSLTRRRTPMLGQMLVGAGCLAGLVLAAASPEDKTLALFSAAWLLYMLLLLAGVFWLGVWDWRAERHALKITGPGGSPPESLEQMPNEAP